jgi:hypothetical protein
MSDSMEHLITGQAKENTRACHKNTLLRASHGPRLCENPETPTGHRRGEFAVMHKMLLN